RRRLQLQPAPAMVQALIACPVADPCSRSLGAPLRLNRARKHSSQPTKSEVNEADTIHIYVVDNLADGTSYFVVDDLFRKIYCFVVEKVHPVCYRLGDFWFPDRYGNLLCYFAGFERRDVCEQIIAKLRRVLYR